MPPIYLNLSIFQYYTLLDFQNIRTFFLCNITLHSLTRVSPEYLSLSIFQYYTPFTHQSVSRKLEPFSELCSNITLNALTRVSPECFNLSLVYFTLNVLTRVSPKVETFLLCNITLPSSEILKNVFTKYPSV